MSDLTWNDLARQQQGMAQSQSLGLSALLSGSLGALGIEMSQQQFLQRPLSLSNIRENLWPEHKKIESTSFYDRLRNEIDEWLKL